MMNLRAYFTNEPTWAEKFLQGERPTPPKNPIKPQFFPSRPITELKAISAEIGAKLYMPDYLPKRYQPISITGWLNDDGRYMTITGFAACGLGIPPVPTDEPPSCDVVPLNLNITQRKAEWTHYLSTHYNMGKSATIATCVIRGHNGISVENTPGSMNSKVANGRPVEGTETLLYQNKLFWEEEGQFIEMTSSSLTLDELFKIAESLRPVD